MLGMARTLVGRIPAGPSEMKDRSFAITLWVQLCLVLGLLFRISGSLQNGSSDFQAKNSNQGNNEGAGRIRPSAHSFAEPQQCSSYDRATTCGISIEGTGGPAARDAYRTHTNKEQITNTKLGSTHVPHARLATSLAHEILHHGAVACAPPGWSPGSDIPQSSAHPSVRLRANALC